FSAREASRAKATYQARYVRLGSIAARRRRFHAEIYRQAEEECPYPTAALGPVQRKGAAFWECLRLSLSVFHSGKYDAEDVAGPLRRCAMPSLEEVERLNRELAEHINHEARSDPSSPYAGKFVGIANGKVVVVSEDLHALSRQLREIEPDPRRVFW